jgi:DNA-binding NarL/FixJ family response regulator
MHHTALLLSDHSATFPDTLKTCLAILTVAKDMDLADSWLKDQDGLAGWTEHSADVMVMDIDLTGASWLEAVRALVERHPAAQFLLCSMHDDAQCLFDALKAVANVDRVKSAKSSMHLTGPRDRRQGDSPMSATIEHRMVARMRPARPGTTLTDAGLTEREREILMLLAEGLLYKEIGSRVGISEGAVKQHIHRMYGKLHVQNRTEAVNKYFGR